MLVGSRIEQIIRPQKPVPADLALDVATRQFYADPEAVLAVTEADGALLGIIEAHDLLHQEDGRQLKVRDVARGDYVLAHPGELAGDVVRNMLARRVDNVVVVEGDSRPRPLGVVRSADLLRLQNRLRDKHMLSP